jgi:hypothetical protein
VHRAAYLEMSAMRSGGALHCIRDTSQA